MDRHSFNKKFTILFAKTLAIVLYILYNNFARINKKN